MQAKPGRAGDICNKVEGLVPLFGELLNKRAIVPCRHLPVDSADIVPGRVLPDLRKLDSLPFEHGMVEPCLEPLDKYPGGDIDLFDLPYELRAVVHQQSPAGDCPGMPSAMAVTAP